MTRIANNNINYVLTDLRKITSNTVIELIKEFTSYILMVSDWDDFRNIHVKLAPPWYVDSNPLSHYMLMLAVDNEQLSFLTLKNLIRTDIHRIYFQAEIVKSINYEIYKCKCDQVYITDLYIDKEHQLQYGYSIVANLSPQQEDNLLNTLEPILKDYFLSICESARRTIDSDSSS